jgi:hypothetical protein
MNGVAFNLTVPPLPVTLMLLIFPDGRLPSRRWWTVVAVASAGYALTFLGVYMPGDEAHIGLPVGIWISIAALLASAAVRCGLMLTSRRSCWSRRGWGWASRRP